MISLIVFIVLFRLRTSSFAIVTLVLIADVWLFVPYSVAHLIDRPLRMRGVAGSRPGLRDF